jgi:hypothetical protein
MEQTLTYPPSLAIWQARQAAARPQTTKPAARPQTDAELKQYLLQTFGIVLPDQRVCEHHSTPFQAFADAYFARSSVSIWKGSRGFGGKTYMLALLGLTEALTLNADVSILGGSGEQSARVNEYIGEFYWKVNENTRALFRGEPVTREARFTAGATIRALMASQKSVRGPHPQRLRMDEADEVKLSLLDSAMGQPMRAGDVHTQVVFSSTHQYSDGTMTELLKRAKDKGWPVHEWCWRETSNPVDGWLSTEEVAQKRADVTSLMWETEYDLQEPSAEGRAIVTEKVDGMFRRDLGHYRGALREVIEIEQPVEGARYATGADWARKQDYTIIVTLRCDCRPMRVVAFQRRGREPWPAMVGAFDAQCSKYKGRAFHDATGIGDVIGQYMKTNATGVMMVGRDRQDLLTEYIAAIEDGLIESPQIDYMQTEHKYASHDDVFKSGAGLHLPDTISAGALAHRGTKASRVMAG